MQLARLIRSLFCALAIAGVPGVVAQTNFALVGYDDLVGYLGAGNVPDGSSVTLTIVEAPVAIDTYRIDTADAQLTGKTITFSPLLDPLTLTSWHATNTARYTTGSTWSMTPGITSIYQQGITASTSTGFYGPDFLNAQSSTSAPLVETRSIQNHSWVGGSTGSSATDTTLIRRFDFAVARDNFVAVVGVNNAASVAAGSPSADPNLNVNLLSGAYHVISVGRANGHHAWGDTVSPVAGRQRPHIVVDASATSWATAITSSAAALLMDGANEIFSPSVADAARDFRVVKSLLMAGAVKDGLGTGGSHTWTAVSSSKPLDEVYGAGRLNVFNSYQILEEGQQAPSASADVSPTGWTLETVVDSAPDRYFFDLTGDPAYNLSISLNWAIGLSPTGMNYNNMVATLANLTLSVFVADDYTLIGGPIAISNSTIENLQYLWLTDLGPGRYAIQVSSGSSTSTEYGLAWQTTPIPEPSVVFLLILGLACLCIISRRRTQVAPSGSLS